MNPSFLHLALLCATALPTLCGSSALAQQEDPRFVQHRFENAELDWPKLLVRRWILPDEDRSRPKLQYPENMAKIYEIQYCASPKRGCQRLGQRLYSLMELKVFKRAETWAQAIYFMAEDLETRRAEEIWLEDFVEISVLRLEVERLLKRAAAFGRLIEGDYLRHLK